MTGSPDAEPVQRRWTPDFPLDIAAVLGPLRRGAGDPACRTDSTGAVWLVATTAEGPGTIALRCTGKQVTACAWGPGRALLLDGLPALLGAGDDDSGFQPHHPLVARLRGHMPGLRLGSTGRVWDVLLAAVIEQKVTRAEAYRSWRELCRRFGAAAPGPAPAGMFAPPTPRALLDITDWEWHRAGLDGARRRTLVAAAAVAHRLEHAVSVGGEQGRAWLRTVPGIGVWTAAEVAQRAWGDADAVSVGDFHLPKIVGHALVGRRLDDDGMLEVLSPYAPQRQRVVRYLVAAGVHPPRRGPRFSPRDYRAF